MGDANTTSQADFTIPYSCYIVESLLMITCNVLAIKVIVSLGKMKTSFYNVVLFLLFVSHLLTALMLFIKASLFLAYFHKDIIEGVVMARDCFISLEINFTILLSFDRFVAVRKPFFYGKLTSRHGAAAIAVAIGLTIFFTAWRTVSTKAYMAAFFVVIIGAVLIIVSNFLLYRSVKRQCRQIAATIVDKSSQQQHDKRQEIRKRELRSLKVCLFIASSYILTWVPLIIVQTLHNFQKANEKDVISVEILIKFLAILTFTNGIWDVVIFFALNLKARTKLLMLLHLSKPTHRRYSDMYATNAISPTAIVRRETVIVKESLKL